MQRSTIVSLRSAVGDGLLLKVRVEAVLWRLLLAPLAALLLPTSGQHWAPSASSGSAATRSHDPATRLLPLGTPAGAPALRGHPAPGVTHFQIRPPGAAPPAPGTLSTAAAGVARQA